MAAMTPAAVTEFRGTLWQRGGFRPVALTDWNAPGPSPGKRPVGQGWQLDARLDPPKWSVTAAVVGALNTGILCDRLRSADFDIDDAAICQICVGHALQVFGYPATYRYRDNSPRKLLPYRAAEGAPVKRSLVGKHGKIEMLGLGQQFCCDGIHDTGFEIKWSGEGLVSVKVTDLPAITEDQITEFFVLCAPHLGVEAPSKPNGADTEPHVAGEPQAEIERVVEMLDGIPNSGPPDWEYWNKIGMAAFAASGGSTDGYRAWDAWSARNPAYDAEATRKRWNHYFRSPPSELGFGTLFHEWSEARRARLEGWIDPGPEAEDVWRAYERKTADGATSPEPQPATPQPEPEPIAEPWPEPMGLDAYHGLFGEALAEIAPYTEADPQAILLHCLVFFGNKIGRGPYYQVDATKHATNEYCLIVGDTAHARKGVAEGWARYLFLDDVADFWAKDRIVTGLSSGEGLIHHVRDERYIVNKKGETELADAGVRDKRLVVVETEFAAVLSVVRREGNTLSPVLRVAWDKPDLRILTKNNPDAATGALVSVIGHITADELRSMVTRTDLTNGLLNRFLVALVRRARNLPHGNTFDFAKLRQIGGRLNEAARAARALGQIKWTQAAHDMWSAAYPDLTKARRGLVGGLTARAEAHAVRLALIYALADGAMAIDCPHLKAAVEVWRYCRDSAAVLFGGRIGELLADTVLLVLKEALPNGMTSTEVLRACGNYAKTHLVLDQLHRDGYVNKSVRIVPGRPGPAAKVWTLRT